MQDITRNYEFNSSEFERFLDHNCYETRAKWRELSKDPIFLPKYDISLLDAKDLALRRLQKVADSKVFSVFDFLYNPLNVFANHEMAGLIDGNLSTKLTVQLNLFGGTVVTLGSERHLEVAKGVDTLKNVGCFCLTELGYGNNAVEMETTATWDDKTSEFIINCPSVLSQKYWITNGALHSNYSVVFAQLYYQGKNEGVHAFLVKIRNEDKTVRAGVELEDMGHKLGLNGLDNARISFKNLRVPRESLLNKYSDIDESGKYISKISKRRDRFLRVADRLLSGRLCISSMCVSATKLVLNVCFRYASKRLAVGKTGKSDTPIMNFQLFQGALYPLLSRTMILCLAFNHIKDLYTGFVTKEPSMDIIRYCCVIKPLISWNLRETAGTAVERCGGQGFLSCNRMCEGIGGGHSGMVAEGDNSVLMQKVTKEIMTSVQMGEYNFPTHKYCPKNVIPNMKDISETDCLVDLLKFREISLITELGNVTQTKMMEGKNIYEIWMIENNDIVQDLAHAFGERIVAEFAILEIKKIGDNNNLYYIFELLLNISLMYSVIKNLGWFIVVGVINKDAANSLLKKFRESLAVLHPQALNIVNSFGIPEHLLTAPIAQDYEDFNSRPNKGEVTGEITARL